jgi:hypothetical protein
MTPPFVPMHVTEGHGEMWRRWFAWRPVRAEQGQLIWLRYTYRRRFWAAAWFVIPFWEEYSDIKQSFWGSP